jgi:hypothetical protein
MTNQCSECGAEWPETFTCRELFHQLLFWENEDTALGEVHHLMVLCFHLQHPSPYSREGLAAGRKILRDFVELGKSPHQVRLASRRSVDSANRSWSITARLENQGAWGIPITWPMTVAEIVAGGMEAYQENVILWANSIHLTLSVNSPAPDTKI